MTPPWGGTSRDQKHWCKCLVCHGATSQVLRDSRHKESSAGVEFSPEEMKVWQSQLAQFFKVNTASAAEKRRQTVKAVTAPRIASLDWMRALENALRMGINKELRHFEVATLLGDATMADGRVRFPEGCPRICSGNTTPNLLVLCSDRQSTQVCSVNYLTYKLGLNLVFICDPAHAGWRAILDGLSRAGFMPAVTVAQLMFNIAYGPFQRSAYFRYIQDACTDISVSIGVHDALLLFFWPRIAAELHWDHPDVCDVEARARFLKALPAMNVSCLKGPKCSTGRFYSFCSAYREWENFHAIKLFVLTWVCLRHGFAKVMSDIFAPAAGDATQVNDALAGDAGPSESTIASNAGVGQKTRPTLRGPSQTVSSTEATGTAGARGPSGSGGASCSSAGPAAGSVADLVTRALEPSSHAKARELGKAATQNERNRSVNTLHAVTRMMANDDLRVQLAMVYEVCNPLAWEYGKAYHEIRSVEDTVRWYSNWAHGSRCANLDTHKASASTTNSAEPSFPRTRFPGHFMISKAAGACV